MSELFGCKNNCDDDDTTQLPADDEVLLQKLREESRAVFLQRKSRELLDNEELQVERAQHSTHCLCFFTPWASSTSTLFVSLQNLWFLLDKHQVPPLSGDEAMINYEAYLQVGEKAGPKCR